MAKSTPAPVEGKTNRECELDGCDRPVKAKGLCQAHYLRLWRYGVVGEPEVSDRTRKPCVMSGCEELNVGLGYCSKHYQRVRTHGDPNCVPPRPTGPEHANWLPDVAITYTEAHRRVRRARGPAKGHSCADGCGSPAVHWSYDHADPNEQRDYRGIPYSVDPGRYRPLCVSCHKRFDLDHLPPRRRQTPEERRAKRLKRYAENRETILAAQRAERAARKRAAELLAAEATAS